MVVAVPAVVSSQFTMEYILGNSSIDTLSLFAARGFQCESETRILYPCLMINTLPTALQKVRRCSYSLTGTPMFFMLLVLLERKRPTGIPQD